ncbi:glycosyltransferase family 4 protein [Stieleria varia]|uniref:GDP-mannose-dependent alpha-(1-2)-phosphatidylinositol mannosyltransferase n=1 Tax=Stieleria varia TaxID=2528005 RepID=A0A5C6B3S5_9BACT|nr:glycosyltransferase family 4 protein [Stieleria varia]TWU06192.1 GDP-mannose-dependent alpha-(1-2)-phosphatidylinositol mannosyltransferase [Stieleria varia]
MRIAYVCADPGVPVFGSKGCSIHVQEMVRAMLARGNDVELFVARTGGEPPPDLRNCIVHEMSIPHCENTRTREVEQVLWNQRVARALDSRPKFDFIYERYALWSANAMLWAKRKNIPSVLEVNSPLIDEQANHRELVQSHLASVMTRDAMRNARTTYVVSHQIVPYCRRFVSEKRSVHVIPNGVNTDRFSPGSKATDPFPGLTIGFIGSLKPWHGVDGLIEAFLRVCRSTRLDLTHPERHATCRLLIVGDGPECQAIKARVLEHAELRDSVRLIGAVDPQSVPGWLNSMDIAVAPYPDLDDFYFSPLKVYEYMAAGRVVLGSATGQIGELIEHGINGWLYPAGDIDSMAQALIDLRQDVSLRERLGRAARETAEGHSWTKVLDQIFDAVTRDQFIPADDHGALRDELQV